MVYKVVHARSLHKLESELVDLIKQGWVPIGGVTAIAGDKTAKVTATPAYGDNDPLMVWPGFYQAVTMN